jgi:hypothetical protein
MKRIWPFIFVPSGLFVMLCGFIYYVTFAGLGYEKPRSEVSAQVATQAHISFVISWLGACFFFVGLLGSSIRLILTAKLSSEAGKTNRLKITWIASGSAFVISILCIVSVMSGGFFIFGPLAVVSAWLLHVPMWVSTRAFHRSWATVFIPLFIQFFAIIWCFVWFIAHKYGKRAA